MKNRKKLYYTLGYSMIGVKRKLTETAYKIRYSKFTDTKLINKIWLTENHPEVTAKAVVKLSITPFQGEVLDYEKLI